MNILEEIKGLKKGVPCNNCGGGSGGNNGGGSGGTLPSGSNGLLIANNSGEVAFRQMHFTVVSTDFTNSRDVVLPAYTQEFGLSIYFVNGSQNIYKKDGQWDYLSGGGFRVLIPDFNAQQDTYVFEVTLKERNANKD